MMNPWGPEEGQHRARILDVLTGRSQWMYSRAFRSQGMLEDAQHGPMSCETCRRTSSNFLRAHIFNVRLAAYLLGDLGRDDAQGSWALARLASTRSQRCRRASLEKSSSWSSNRASYLWKCPPDHHAIWKGIQNGPVARSGPCQGKDPLFFDGPD